MRYLIALTFAAISGAALAGQGQADVCYSAGAATGDVEQLTGPTALRCPLAGTHTLSELAQGGWSIVSVQPVTTEYAPGASAEAPRSRSAWMVVIQKGGK